LGGTVGDIESAPFVEAMRQFQFRVGHGNFALIHVSLVPDMHGEQKTKPTQTTVRDLRGLGLMPDIIACRVLVGQPLGVETKRKISMFCHVSEGQVVGIHDVSSVYHVPLLLLQQGIVPYLQQRLGLGDIKISDPLKEKGTQLMDKWKAMTDVIGYCYFVSSGCDNNDFCRKYNFLDPVSIVLVGKYTDMPDSYMSVVKSLEHSASRCRRKLELKVISSFYERI
jgi:CTP synthase